MKLFFEQIYQCRREFLVAGIGTFILIFTGTGAVMVNHISAVISLCGCGVNLPQEWV